MLFRRAGAATRSKAAAPTCPMPGRRPQGVGAAGRSSAAGGRERGAALKSFETQLRLAARSFPRRCADAFLALFLFFCTFVVQPVTAIFVIWVN
jgi:hypothetical protein